MAENIKLIILQGPRQGESVEYPSKSTIKIGRVVRGNTLTIKDEGISSKHLIIQFEADLGKWVVQDLDSSNGTAVNSSKLTPFTRFNLNHGDTLKLGEDTSILVEIFKREEVEEEVSKLRRNPRRKGKDLEVKTDKDNVVEEKIRRGRPPKPRVENKKELGESLNCRDTRGSVKKTKELGSERGVVVKVEVESESEKENVDVVVMDKQPRRGRARKASGVLGVEERKDLGCGENVSLGGGLRNVGSKGESERENADVVMDKQPRRGRPRKASGVSGVEEHKELECGENVSMGGGSENGGLKKEELEGKKVSSYRVTRSIRNEDSFTVSENLDGKRTRGGRGKRKDLQEVLPAENVESGMDSREVANEKVSSVDVSGDKVKESDVQIEIDGGIVEDSMDLELDSRDKAKDQANEGDINVNEQMKCENRSSVKEKGGSSDKKQVNEKMTLGEWFGYMEENMPKHLIRSAEDIISEMRMRGEEVKQCIADQMRAKAAAAAVGGD